MSHSSPDEAAESLGTDALFLVSGAGFLTMVEPYQTLQVEARATQSDVIEARAHAGPLEPRQASAWFVLASPARRLAWHLLDGTSSNKSETRVRRERRVGGRVRRAARLLREALGREASGDSMRAEHLWPLVHGAWADVLRDAETATWLTGVAEELGLPSPSEISVGVVAAARRELLASVHAMLVAAGACDAWSGRGPLHAHWARHAGHAEALPTHLKVLLLFHERGVGLDALEAILEVADELLPADRLEMRGCIERLAEACLNLLDEPPAPEGERVIACLARATEVFGFSRRLHDALGQAYFKLASATPKPARGAFCFSRAAALMPERPEAGNALRAMAAAGTSEELRRAIDEGLQYIDSPEGQAAAAARRRAALLTIAAGLDLEPDDDGAELAAACLSARDAGGRTALDALASRRGAPAQTAVDRLENVLVSLPPGAELGLVARSLEPPPSWRGITGATRELAAAWDAFARSLPVAPKQRARWDRAVADAWLRTRADVAFKTVAALGVALSIVSLAAFGIGAYRENVRAAAYSAVRDAVRRGDDAAVRGAARIFLGASPSADDPRVALVSGAYRHALVVGVGTATSDGEREALVAEATALPPSQGRSTERSAP